MTRGGGYSPLGARQLETIETITLLRRVGQRPAHDMIRILVRPGTAPGQKLDVTVRVDVVGATGVAVVTNPTLVAIFSAAPLHQGRLADPGIVVVLRDATVIRVVRRVHRLGISF